MRASVAFIAPLAVLIASTAGAVDSDSLRLRKAGGGVELSWTDPTPTVACIARDAVAPPGTLLLEVTGLSYTDAPPAAALLFYDVAEPSGGTCGAVLPTCSVAGVLACGVPLSSRNDAAGSADRVDSWTGCAGADATGSEIVYSFTASQAGLHVAGLTGAPAGLDIRILRDAGAGCDPAQCIAFDDASASFTAAAGATYYVVVDAQAGPSGAFTLEVTCPALPATCAPAATLACGVPISSRNDGSGSADRVDSWTGCAGADATGSEIVYSFTAAQSGAHVAGLSGAPAGLDIRVIRDGGAGCDPAQCIAFDDASASFTATAGATYYVVVDAQAGASGAFTLQVDCPVVTGGCAPVAPLSCGGTDSRFSAGPGSSRSLSAHPSCFASGLVGSEMLYSFTAPSADSFDVRLLGGGAELDILVLRDIGGGCATAECVAYGDVAVSFTGIAGQQYFIVVDGTSLVGSNYTIGLSCPAQQCSPDQALLCGNAVAHSNAWPVFTDVNDVYPCSTFDFSGPEYAFRFTATQTGDATVTLSNLTAELDVFVTEESAGCDPAACVAYGDDTVTFPIVGGTTYDVIIDGRSGAEGFFRVDLTCAVPPSACDAHAVIRCGDLVGNDTSAGRDAVASWPCSTQDASGPEYSFLFVPTESATVRVVMDLNTEDLDLHVVQGAGAGCDPAACIAWGDQEVTFDGVAGETYYVVVDGRAGVNDLFRLWMDCQRVPGACRPAQPIRCGETLAGRNDAPGSTDAIDLYDCRPYPEEGPEITYSFVATTAGMATASLANLSADLDLFVLRDDGLGCNQASCVGAGNASVDFAVTAGATYYLVVEGYSGATGSFDLTLGCF